MEAVAKLNIVVTDFLAKPLFLTTCIWPIYAFVCVCVCVCHGVVLTHFCGQIIYYIAIVCQ